MGRPLRPRSLLASRPLVAGLLFGFAAALGFGLLAWRAQAGPAAVLVVAARGSLVALVAGCLTLALIPRPAATRAPAALLAICGLVAIVGAGSWLVPLPPVAAFALMDHDVASRTLTRLGPVAVPPRATATRPARVVSTAAWPRLPGRSVVLITVDALRADGPGFAGARDARTPFLDRLSRTSLVYTNAWSVSPTSSFSLPALHHGRAVEAALRTGARTGRTLADRLAAIGYETLAFYPDKIWSVGPRLMAPLAERRLGFAKRWPAPLEARALSREVQQRLREEGRRPVFLWLHIYDPHLPYDCHDRSFGDEPRDCYRAEIAHVDAVLAALVPELERMLTDPLLVVTADHGEAFGEHGRLYHSTDLHAEQLRVPLLLHGSGLPAARLGQPVALTALAGTLLAVLGAGEPSGADASLPLAPQDEAPPVFAGFENQRAIIDGRWKLQCHDWPDGPCALYDLQRDPGEKENVIGRGASEYGRLRDLLTEQDRNEIGALSAADPRPLILGRLGRRDALPALVTLAREDGPHAVEAARLIAGLATDAERGALEALAADRDPARAAWATLGLARLGRSVDPERLARFLDAAAPLGEEAALVLGRRGDPRARARLVRMLDEAEPGPRASAALALGGFHDAALRPALERLLAVRQVRWAAIDALGELGDPAAIPALTAILDDEANATYVAKTCRALDRLHAAPTHATRRACVPAAKR